MYDIFDDIFDDGYGYDNDYGMSDTDVDVELAFEAAMGTGTDYEYDYATEGFRDAMGKIGTKIADSARNMVRKIGEMFKKLGQWVKDRIAPLRAKAASGDNKALQQVLKSLDRQVQNASGPRKAEMKQKVARIKRAIMQSIDAQKRAVNIMNRALNDGVSIFKAARSIGQSFIEKLQSAVAYGNEKGNTDDGNDLVDKMNSLLSRYTQIVHTWDHALDDTESDEINEIIKNEMPGGSDRMKAIIKAVKFDKVDFKAIFAAEAELQVTCSQGQDAANRLTKKLEDKYEGYRKDDSGKWGRGDIELSKNEKFDSTSRQYLSALLANWNKFVGLEQGLAKGLTAMSDSLSKGGGYSLAPVYDTNPDGTVTRATAGGEELYARVKNGKAGDRYNAGFRSTGSRREAAPYLTEEPTDNELGR